MRSEKVYFQIQGNTQAVLSIRATFQGRMLVSLDPTDILPLNDFLTKLWSGEIIA